MVSEEGVTAQTAWYKTMQTSSNAAKELFDNEENLIKSGNSVRLSEEAISNATNTMTFSAKAGQVALKGLAMAGNMLVSFGISAIISLAIKGLDNLAHAADNAKESAESFSNSFKSMNEEFTSNDNKLSDLQKQYNELSKGVNSLGENVSLTTDEYDTYKKVISEISDMMPNLLARYDDEGNKIGFVQGKLKDLSAEYDNYKRKKAMDLVNGENDNGDSIKDVFKNYGYQIRHENADGTVVGNTKVFGSSNYEKITQLQAQMKYGDGNHAGFSKLTNEEIEEKTALIQKYQSEIDASVSSIQDAMIAIGQSGNEYYKLSDKQQQFFDTYIGSLSQDAIDKNGLYNETAARTFVNNFIKDIKADKNKVLEAYNDLLSFDVNDSSLNPEQIKEQVDKLLQALAKALGDEDWQDLKIRLGFEFVDDNASDYEKFVDRTKNKLSKFGGEGTGKLMNFFSANGIDSSKGVNEFLDVYNATEQAKKGIYDADIAMQEWSKHSKEASDTSTPTTLSSAWEQLKASTDDATKGVADDLQTLADKGELTIDTFKATDGAENYFDGLGISAENAVKYINSLSDKNSQLGAMSKNIKSITDALGTKASDGLVSVDDLSGFDATIKGLNTWEKFSTLLGDASSSMEDCQKVANELATEYVNSESVLSNLNETNRAYYESQLDNMGVTNSAAVVEAALAKNLGEEKIANVIGFEDIYWVGTFTCKQVMLNDSIIGFNLIFTANTPYALQEDKSFNIELSDTLESDIVFTSDVYGYIDADYVITVKETGDLKFDTYYYNPDTKVYTLDREFTVKNCTADEKIYVKGDTQLVTRSRAVHELGKDCNFILPRLINTYQSDDEEVRNKIKSNLKCNVQITYNPTAMIGYGYKS